LGAPRRREATPRSSPGGRRPPNPRPTVNFGPLHPMLIGLPVAARPLPTALSRALSFRGGGNADFLTVPPHSAAALVGRSARADSRAAVSAGLAALHVQTSTTAASRSSISALRGPARAPQRAARLQDDEGDTPAVRRSRGCSPRSPRSTRYGTALARRLPRDAMAGRRGVLGAAGPGGAGGARARRRARLAVFAASARPRCRRSGWSWGRRLAPDDPIFLLFTTYRTTRARIGAAALSAIQDDGGLGGRGRQLRGYGRSPSWGSR